MEFIRKISVGADYKTSAMHYIVGQEILNKKYNIHLIKRCKTKNSYQVFIINTQEEVILWKEFSESMPVSIEYSINF
tara:strand:- start:1182 stop:1412 length:231 start_codon:yes stop_codon:yes gene_type:complete